MSIARSFRYGVACLVFAFIPSRLAADDGLKDQVRILYIDSYERGYSWGDETEQAFRDEMLTVHSTIDISTEYLDGKRFSDPDTRSLFAEYLGRKYARYDFDLVVAADNAAFDFVIKHRDTIAERLPIVFCGYNLLREEILDGIPDITGVNEEVNLASTVDLAIASLPRVKSLAFIISTADESSSRTATLVESTIAPRLSGRYAVSLLKNKTLTEIQSSLEGLDSDSAAFIAGWASDSPDGIPLTPAENSRRIAVASPVPCFGFWDFQMGTGIVGGRILSGREQGKSAASLAARILGGEPVSSIPPIMDSPTTALFDWTAMVRFKIPEANLPEGSILLNRPETLWMKYGTFIVAGLALIIAETALIIALLRARRRRKTAIFELERERSHLEKRVEERTSELAEKSRSLEATLRQRELLLKEIHHRVKNNMCTVSGLLSLQAASIDNPDAIAALEAAQGRIGSMSVLYDKLYREGGSGRLGLAEYLVPLSGEILDNFPKRIPVSISCDAEDVELDAKTLQLIGIIVNELLTNAMKYAFPNADRGEIRITAAARDGMLEISVSDNGIGFPMSSDRYESDGFGSTLVDLLAQQLGGTIKAGNEGGARTVLRVPLYAIPLA